MDIDQLTGKALGIEVARAMGWKEWKADTTGLFYDYDGPYPVFYEDDFGRLQVGEKRLCFRAWTPWRDMNDCWEVVKNLSSRWLSVRKKFVDALKSMAMFRASFGYSGVVDPLWFLFFVLDDPCEVILRAALKAMGGEG